MATSKLRIAERIIIGILAVLIIAGFISRTISGWWVDSVNNAYWQGLWYGAQLDTEPNVCKVGNDYYQITSKDWKLYLTTKEHRQIPVKILDAMELIDMRVFYYESSVKANGLWNNIMVTMYYKQKTCDVGIATCKKLRDCNKFSDGGMGVLVDKP